MGNKKHAEDRMIVGKLEVLFRFLIIGLKICRGTDFSYQNYSPNWYLDLNGVGHIKR